ncbi:2-haloacid dehalogenase [Exophiala aquamarina CBS 119918]|uniref:2-haloacid dehalogenase n=1 Tax=Exophiala aquamarina CBS 119918 TaxID=1182545 RepID=A0A072P2B4_9EURO|nr:2-haloacid dehalogenase [Exophiala aquamarina CBS 119918]KEF54254.1 2-haloacid dehalogenase [Exophiala aquamarina CBS 119918]
METSSKHVVFDVVGTCVSFDAFYECIDAAIGNKLRQHTITPKHFGFTWQTAAELEFTFLSISERYKQYNDVLRSMFYRSLWLAGISDPRAFATDDERERCIRGYSSLPLRSGCSECFQKLREAGFTVWCFTTGDIKRVRGYFERADVEMPLENFLTCDTKGVAKPALAAYKSVLEQLAKGDEKWFAAAHMWDVSAAVRAGFTGAYCTVYEKEACLEIFDEEMKVMADSLPEMAEGIIQASRG